MVRGTDREGGAILANVWGQLSMRDISGRPSQLISVQLRTTVGSIGGGQFSSVRLQDGSGDCKP